MNNYPSQKHLLLHSNKIKFPTPQKVTSDNNLFSFALSTAFALVSSTVSHLKEDEISFVEKKYFSFKTPCILNHAKKMAYSLHELSCNF